VNASCLGFAGGVKTCLCAGFAGFCAGLAGFFAGFAGGWNAAVVVVAAVVVPATAVVVVVAAVVVVPGGDGLVPAGGFVVVVPPQFVHVVVVVEIVVVVVGSVVVVGTVVVAAAHFVFPLSLPPLPPPWFWSQFPWPPPLATQLPEPSACWLGGHVLPGPVGCAFRFDGWARATADATPAAITTASTAPTAIGRNRKNLCLKLFPFYGLRIFEPIVGAPMPFPEPPSGYFHPALRLVLVQGPLPGKETEARPFACGRSRGRRPDPMGPRRPSFQRARGGRAPTCLIY
jgi:hypothetical protein